MDRLRVPLAAIAPSGAIVDVVVTTADLSQPEGVEGLPVGSIAVNGEMSEAGREYLFIGTVSGTFKLTCDRCIEAAEHPFHTDVCWTFVESTAPEADADVNDDDDVVRTFAGNEIDLAPEVWEEVVLAAPAKFLCSPDCAGLCPHCGVNWNRATCNCNETEELDRKGLAGLADLLPKLKPDRLEE